MPKLPLVVISPNIPVSTKWVFDKYKASNEDVALRNSEIENIPDTFTTKKSIVKFIKNDLEQVTIDKYPVLNDLKTVLVKLGAIAAQMTGSGPSVFGIFPNQEVAEKAVEKISKHVSDCRVFLAENI